MKALARGAKKLFGRSPRSDKPSSGIMGDTKQSYEKKNSESSNDLLTRIMIDKATERVGKIAGKKIPIIGLASTIDSVHDRIKSGDYTGAAMEALSGAAAQVPGIGTAVSLGIDAAQLARDSKIAADEAEKNTKQNAKETAGKKPVEGMENAQTQSQKQTPGKVAKNEKFDRAREKVDDIFSFVTFVLLDILADMLKEKGQKPRALTEETRERAERETRRHIMLNDGEKAVAAALNVLDERGDMKPEVKKDVMGNANKIFTDAKIAVHESEERATDKKEHYEGKRSAKVSAKGNKHSAGGSLSLSQGGIPENIKKMAGKALGRNEEVANLTEKEKLIYPNREMGETVASPSVERRNSLKA